MSTPTEPKHQPPLDRQAVRQSTREELTNLPNILTLLRIVLIPPVMALMVWGTPKTSFFAACLFGVAAVTDWLDGWLARRRNQESLVGKLLDPLADKLLVMACLIISAELHRIPGWFVVLLLSRELTITGLRAMASSEGLEIKVIESGKLKTALQLVGLFALLIHFRYEVDFLFTSHVVDFNVLGFWLLALSMVFSLLSAGRYFGSFMQAIAVTKVERS